MLVLCKLTVILVLLPSPLVLAITLPALRALLLSSLVTLYCGLHTLTTNVRFDELFVGSDCTAALQGN
jgi:hypothetical protein